MLPVPEAVETEPLAVPSVIVMELPDITIVDGVPEAPKVRSEDV